MENTTKEDVYKSALEIILALCEKVEFKTSETITVQTICETVLQREV